MSKRLDETLGTVGYDNLINGYILRLSRFPL